MQYLYLKPCIDLRVEKRDWFLSGPERSCIPFLPRQIEAVTVWDDYFYSATCQPSSVNAQNSAFKSPDILFDVDYENDRHLQGTRHSDYIYIYMHACIYRTKLDYSMRDRIGVENLQSRHLSNPFITSKSIL